MFGLAITEGIEDALSVHQATGLGAWAAGSAPYMPALALTVPRYIECVTIYDHPDNGQSFARKLAEAIAYRGKRVRAVARADVRVQRSSIAAGSGWLKNKDVERGSSFPSRPPCGG